jgi:hypothetical protein
MFTGQHQKSGARELPLYLMFTRQHQKGEARKLPLYLMFTRQHQKGGAGKFPPYLMFTRQHQKGEARKTPAIPYVYKTASEEWSGKISAMPISQTGTNSKLSSACCGTPDRSTVQAEQLMNRAGLSDISASPCRTAPTDDAAHQFQLHRGLSRPTALLLTLFATNPSCVLHNTQNKTS